MIKNLYLIVFCVFLMMYSMTDDVFSQAEMENYVSKIVLDLKWGSGPDEIGYKEKVLSDIPGGPSSFEVDDNGNIYILDCGNKYIKKFDNKGELIQSFPVALNGSAYKKITSLDENNNIWVHEKTRRTFRVYSFNGTLIKTIIYSGMMVLEFKIHDGEIIGESSKLDVSEVSSKIGIGGEPVYDAEAIRYESKYESKYRLQKYSKRNYFAIPPDYNQLAPQYKEMEIIEENGEKHKFVFKDIDPIYTPGFIEDDKNGNMYVELRNLNKQHLLKYNQNLELVAKINDIGTSNNFLTIEKRIVMDSNGNIYVMQVNKSKIQVIKWYKEQ